MKTDSAGLGYEIGGAAMTLRSDDEIAEGLQVQVERIFELVLAERRHQDEKWGKQSHDPDRWHTILSEEVGEVAKAVLENDIALARELIQVIAVCVCWLEQLGDFLQATSTQSY